MDYLKTQAPFWKKEHTPEGARWVDARVSDDAALARWGIAAGNAGPCRRERRRRCGCRCWRWPPARPLGALARWGAGLWLNARWAGFPLGTLFVNCVGGLLIGMALAWFERSPNELLRLLLVTGFLGGLTTFSAFSAESLLLLQRGALGPGRRPHAWRICWARWPVRRWVSSWSTRCWVDLPQTCGRCAERVVT